jgi:hypothetical protein
MEDQDPQSPKANLTYEETPIIEPITEAVHTSSETPPLPKPAEVPVSHSNVTPSNKSSRKMMGNILFFVILFGLGIWLSLQLRSFLSPPAPVTQIAPSPTVVSVPTLTPFSSASSSASIAGWIAYQVVSGSTKKVMPGVVYKLPASVEAPVCDGSNCPSLGTNLPGGTRFTVAARGKGYTLPDFRGAILTDASGHQFTMKQSIVGGKAVYEYVGDFTGRTGGGYNFSKMRGVLVPVTDLVSVEFNHFAPVGATTDFAADDALLDQVISTFDTSVIPVATTSGS